jgi:hypothetical protein
MGSRPRLSNIGRGKSVGRLQLPGGPILAGLAQLEGIAVEAGVPHCGA